MVMKIIRLVLYNVTWADRPRHNSVPSGILMHPAVSPQQTLGQKLGAVPLLRGAGSPSNNVARAEAYLRTK